MKGNISRHLKIVQQILEGKKTLVEIGLEFGISKQRVRQIGSLYNANKSEIKRARREKAVSALKVGFKEQKTLQELSKELKIPEARLAGYYHYETGNSFYQQVMERRNKTISEKFVAGKTAKKITEKVSRVLDNPSRVKTVNQVYSINTKNNVRRYPNIGDRSKGGCFLDKKILNFIATQYMKNKTTEEIAQMLNDKKLKTTQGLPFTAGNIFSYINKMRTGHILI